MERGSAVERMFIRCAAEFRRNGEVSQDHDRDDRLHHDGAWPSIADKSTRLLRALHATRLLRALHA